MKKTIRSLTTVLAIKAISSLIGAGKLRSETEPVSSPFNEMGRKTVV